MLFDVEADQGSRIVAYVVPDSGGGTPSVRIRGDGVDLATVTANEMRPNLVAAGRHATGRCGFVIDETIVPGLAAYTDLEIIETSRGTLIYRRRQVGHESGTRVFRLETHLQPLDALDATLQSCFQYWYPAIDRLGLETSTQVFCLEADSIFISGRLLLKNFEYYLVRGFKTVGLVRDPADELAARLRLLIDPSLDLEGLMGNRDFMSFATTIDHVRRFDISDMLECRRLFRQAREDVLRTLSNPLVRQLTTSAPGDMPNSSAVPTALDALAGFDVLGLRSSSTSFVRSLATHAGIDYRQMPRISEDPNTTDLGDRLRKIPIVQDILEKDFEVFYAITHAFRAHEA